MNKPKKTGIVDVDTPQMKDMRQAVVEQELSARSWKAYWEKMYYTIECEKIQPEYDECQKRMQQKLQDEKAKMEEFLKSLQGEIDKKNEEDPVGELKLEPENQ